jgi:hypothetical protein
MYPRKVLLLFLCLIACGKRESKVEDYFPKIEWVDVHLNEDASVTLRAKVISRGADDVVSSGFCADTVSEPSLTKNQFLMSNSSTDMVEATYRNLHTGSTYYFRAFSGNNYGYTTTSTIAVKAQAPNFEKYDCHAEDGKLKIQSSGSNVDYSLVQPVLTSRAGWNVQGRSGGNECFIYIISRQRIEVAEGIYTATTTGGSNEAQVEINVTSDFWSPGAKQITRGHLLVRMVDSSHYRFTLCDGEGPNSDLVTFSFICSLKP